MATSAPSIKAAAPRATTTSFARADLDHPQATARAVAAAFSALQRVDGRLDRGLDDLAEPLAHACVERRRVRQMDEAGDASARFHRADAGEHDVVADVAPRIDTVARA